MRFPNITDELGEAVELTEEALPTASAAPRPEGAAGGVRGNQERTEPGGTRLAPCTPEASGDLFYSACRRYSSALEASLYGDNIPTAVYDTVIDLSDEESRAAS